MRYQHGDVCFVAVKDIPKDLTWKRVEKGYVVEKGEGVHTHTLIDDCEIAEKDGVLYLRAIPDCKFGVDHEEHKVETLEPDVVWRKGIELEYDAESDEARRTQD